MGIFLILAGVVLGFGALVVFTTAKAITGQLFAGEVAICGAVLFAAGAIIGAVDKLRKAAEAGETAAKKANEITAA